MNNYNPLVSICIPVLNGAKSIHRSLESSLHQSYKNIEVVVLDDGSDDGTAQVVESYAKKDSRVKLVRNVSNIGAAKSYPQLLGCAKGELSQILCHDDWLSRNYVEEGVKIFSFFPETAAVIARCLTLADKGSDKFEFLNDKKFKPGSYSLSYFLRNTYKSVLTMLSAISMMRRADALRAASWMVQVIEKPPLDVPYELKQLQLRGYCADVLIPIKALSQYGFFHITDKSTYVKTVHSNNIGAYGLSNTSAEAIFKKYFYLRCCYDYLFRDRLKNYSFGMRTFMGVEAIINFIVKSNNTLSSRKDFFNFWRTFSLIEKCGIIAKFSPRLLSRGLSRALRRLPTDLSKNFYKSGYFLDEKGNFSAV